MLKHLTVPRLATIQAFFKTKSDKDILGCYAWNQAVGAGLLPILGDFEVSFRNALHRALSQHFGGLDSFVWEVLISGLSHSSQPAGLQAAILAVVFPHAPDTLAVPFGDQAFRKRVLDLLKRVRDVRNRIGHHDSLWATPEFNHLGALGLVPRRPRHTINSLQLFADNVRWFAGWIDPQISTHIQNSDHWWSLQALLHRQALVTYRELGGAVGTYRAILDSTELPQRGTKKSPRKPRRKFLARLIADRHFY